MQCFSGSFDQHSVLVPRIRLPFTTQQFIQLQDMHSPYGQSDQGGIVNVRQYIFNVLNL